MRECPLCKQSYGTDRMQILEERHGAHLVHMTCTNCASAILALVLITPIGVSSVGMMTDLVYDDAKRFQSRRPFTEEDMLDFYTALHASEEERRLERQLLHIH